MTYLALGDSYTIGESVDQSDRWPLQLESTLEETSGLSIQTTIIATTGWRTDDLLQAAREKTANDTFDMVSLLIGVNNQYQGKPISQYKEELPELLMLAIERVGGDTNKVFMVSIPDYYFTPFGQGQKGESTSTELDAYNAFAASLCGEMGIQFINITDISRRGIADPALVANDGLHPSGRQYALWVARVLSQRDFMP